MAEFYYEEIFQHNGGSYHHAMQSWPNVRDEEFAATLSFLSLKDGDHILDVPAGGGYLQRYLPPLCHYHGRDFSDGFGESHSQILKCSELDLGMAESSVDVVVSLAALHHVENKPAFFQAVKRVLKPQGLFLIGDVIVGSKEDDFLNGFVDKWNKLGHEGDFIDPVRDIETLIKNGFDSHYSQQDYRWNFDSQGHACDYFKHLFCLNKNPSYSHIKQAIAKLGMTESASAFHIDWSLGFISARLR